MQISIAFSATAQLYRPQLNWYEIESQHFRVIFHQGFDSVALATARILEYHYKPVQRLTGGELNRFPVVLNGYNDLSNGYVTPINFRMEVEIPPIKGKFMNPQSGGWLENVMPHELVHAHHFSVVPPLGFNGMLYPFWPDGARSLHFIAPLGFHEGLAVHYESEMIPGVSGRGNLPFFTNQIHSVLSGPNRWTFGQYLNTVNQTRPYERHYQGGYEFVSWLQKKKGKHVAVNIIDFMGRFPFFGYGGAYLFTQWEFPYSVFREFELDKLNAEQIRQKSISERYSNFTIVNRNTGYSPNLSIVNGKKEQTYLSPKETNSSSAYSIIDLPFKGESIRRPTFLTDSTLIFYGSFYDQKSGFYQFNYPSFKIDRLLTTNTVEDYKLDLNWDSSSILFARYDIHPKFDATYTSGLYEFNASSSKLKPISVGNRLFNPIHAGNHILAFQTNKETNKLVRVDSAGTISEILNPGIYNLIDMDFSELSGKIALIVNIHGDIALFIANSENELPTLLSQKPTLFHPGVNLYDPVWHPNENKILFTADPNGVMNVFEHNFDTRETTQISRSYFNAYEGSYSPDGSLISCVYQINNEQKLGIIQRNAIDTTLSYDFTPENYRHLKQNRVWADTSITLKSSQKEYKSGLDWLRPRGVIPFLGEHAMSRQYGASFIGTDILQRHTWFSTFSWQFDAPWYDISYRYSGFWPGFEWSLFKKPIDILDQSGNYFIFNEQGFSFGIPFQWNIEQNISTTSLFINPKIKRTTYSYETTNYSNPIDYSDLVNGSVWTASFFTQFNWKVIQRTRDVQPSEGLIIFSQADVDLSTNPFYNIYPDSVFKTGVRKRIGVFSGLYGFLPIPFLQNHSLRLGYRNLYQPHITVFSISNLIWKTNAQTQFVNSDWVNEISGRYTFPIFYPENGGVLIPWYLQNIYGVVFGRSHFGSKDEFGEIPTNHIYGAGLRFVTGVSNLRIDLGISWFLTVGRSKPESWIGDF